jgi:hypothetical protein
VSETVARLSKSSGPSHRVFFVHLNHTNSLLWDGAAVRQLRRKGFGVASEGQRVPL